jgi:hypothetical protein
MKANSQEKRDPNKLPRTRGWPLFKGTELDMTAPVLLYVSLPIFKVTGQAIIPLSASVDVTAVADLLAKAIMEDDPEQIFAPVIEGSLKLPGRTFVSSRFKSRLTIFPVKRELMAILDIAKVADLILYVTSATDLVRDKVCVSGRGIILGRLSLMNLAWTLLVL